MELEVSYNENYCVEGQVERRRGATDRDDGGDKLWVWLAGLTSRPVIVRHVSHVPGGCAARVARAARTVFHDA